LELAIEVTRRESPARRKQIDDFLSDPLWIRPWIEVATFAAGCAQGRALNLQPWEFPPCHISDIASALNVVDDLHGYRAAAQLQQRMERAGVSRWHPDPARECDRAEGALAIGARLNIINADSHGMAPQRDRLKF
jgi:hypothetical protein